MGASLSHGKEITQPSAFPRNSSVLTLPNRKISKGGIIAPWADKNSLDSEDNTPNFSCYNCNEPGHISRNCPKKREETTQKSRDYDDYNKTGQNDYPENSLFTNKLEKICYKCKEKGHYGTHCPNKQESSLGKNSTAEVEVIMILLLMKIKFNSRDMSIYFLKKLFLGQQNQYYKHCKEKYQRSIRKT